MVLADLLQALYAAQTVEAYDTSGYLQQAAAPGWEAHARAHQWTGTSAFGQATVAVSIEDALLLYSLVLATKPQFCVEVGRYYGLSTCMIAAALKENGTGRLLSIDSLTETDGQSTQKAIAHLERFGLLGVVDLQEGFGVEVMAKVLPQAGPVDFFFEDASHTAKTIRAHTEAVSPYLSVPAYLVYHDSLVLAAVAEGIAQTVDVLGRDKVEQVTIGTWRGLTVLRRYKE